MKKFLLKRFLPILLTAVMLFAAAVPAFGASISAPNVEEPYYTVVLEDGVLTLRLNPDKVYEVLRDGELTREELKKFIPEDVLNALTDGEELSLGKLASIAANYISADDLVEIYNMVPAEVFFEYFDLSLLAEVVTLDELLAIVPLDKIIADIPEEDIKALINEEAFGLLLTDKVKDTILTDEFIDSLLEDGDIVSEIANDGELHDALAALVDKGVIEEMLTDAKIKAAIIALAESDGAVDRVLADSGAVTELKDYMVHHPEKLDGEGGFLKCPNVTSVLYDSTEIKNFLETHVTPHVIIDDPDIKIDYTRLLDEYDITEENFKSFIDSGKSGISFEALEGYESLEELIQKEPALDLDEFCDFFVITVENLRAKRFISNKDVAVLVSHNWDKMLDESGLLESLVHTVGMHEILEHFGRDEMVAELGGYFALIEKGYFSEEDVVKAIGGAYAAEGATDEEKTVEGYKKLIDLLLPERLDDIIDIVGYERWKTYIKFDHIVDAAGGSYADLARLYSIKELSKIAKAIGIGNIVDFAREHDIEKKLDVKNTLRDIFDLALSKKSEIKTFAKEFAKCVSSFVTREMEEGIYLNGKQIYKYGTFDLQAMVTATMQAIPDIDKFLEMESGDVFCELILSADVRGEEFRAGFAIEFMGDLTRLQKLAESRADYFRIDVTDELDVTAEVVIPAVASELYMRGLNSSRVPARLKTKILEFPTMTVSDMSDLLSGLTEEELVSYSEEIMEKVDEIKARVYAELEERLGSDSNALNTAKAKADEILAMFTDGDKLIALRNKGVSALDKVAAKTGDVTVADIYKGQSEFSFDRDFSVDLWVWANKIVTLPEEVLIIFGNDMTVSGSLDMTLTVNGLYKATVTGADGITSEFFLPSGISMSVLNDYTSVAYDFTDEKMPAKDATFIHEELFTLEFYDENDKLLGTVGYTDKVDPDTALYPKVPEKAGYSGAWQKFTLRSEKVIKVYPEYTPIKYTATFVVGSEIIEEIEFDLANGLSKAEPSIPQRNGYTAAWEPYTLGASDIIIEAVYTPIKYTATFVVDGETVKTVEFTVETAELEGVPAIPEKIGYTAKWSDYTLRAENITIEAVYTVIIYKADFMADGVLIGSVNFTVNDTSITEPAVPEKEGYTGAWEAYTLGAADIVINAVYTEIETETEPPIVVIPDDGNSMLIWWILLAVIVMMLIIWILSKNSEGTDPEPEPVAAPEPKPEPEAEPEAAPEAEPVPEPGEIEIVESITPEAADELMSNERAETVVETVGGAGVGAKAIINVSVINSAFENGDTVDIDTLKAKGLIPDKTQRIKVLADGTLNKSITVYAEQFSVQAIKMITLTGGKVIQKK